MCLQDFEESTRAAAAVQKAFEDRIAALEQELQEANETSEDLIQALGLSDHQIKELSESLAALGGDLDGALQRAEENFEREEAKAAGVLTC